MKIAVSFTGQLRTLLGASREELETIGPLHLSELLFHLGRDRAAAARVLTSADGGAGESLIPILNGEQLPRGADPLLEDGDQLTLLLPISGGAS